MVGTVSEFSNWWAGRPVPERIVLGGRCNPQTLKLVSWSTSPRAYSARWSAQSFIWFNKIYVGWLGTQAAVTIRPTYTNAWVKATVRAHEDFVFERAMVDLWRHCRAAPARRLQVLWPVAGPLSLNDVVEQGVQLRVPQVLTDVTTHCGMCPVPYVVSFHIRTPRYRQTELPPFQGLVYFLQNFAKFFTFSVTLNLWTHIWSIKYRRK